MSKTATYPWLAWYGSLLVGSLPTLVAGLLASALANRLELAAWAVTVAVGHATLLRLGWRAGWQGRALAAVLLAFSAVSWGLFAGLLSLHHEVLDLGLRAWLPRPWFAGPRAALVLAIALAGAAGGFLLSALRRQRENRERTPVKTDG